MDSDIISKRNGTYVPREQSKKKKKNKKKDKLSKCKCYNSIVLLSVILVISCIERIDQILLNFIAMASNPMAAMMNMMNPQMMMQMQKMMQQQGMQMPAGMNFQQMQKNMVS